MDQDTFAAACGTLKNFAVRQLEAVSGECGTLKAQRDLSWWGIAMDQDACPRPSTRLDFFLTAKTRLGARP